MLQQQIQSVKNYSTDLQRFLKEHNFDKKIKIYCSLNVFGEKNL